MKSHTYIVFYILELVATAIDGCKLSEVPCLKLSCVGFLVQHVARRGRTVEFDALHLTF